jgi:hypothetical protein
MRMSRIIGGDGKAGCFGLTVTACAQYFAWKNYT